MLTTQAEIRSAFWQDLHQKPIPRFNDYPADVRMLFVEYVDMLHKNGQITHILAAKVTL